jgi:hypothetical protein
MKTDDFKPRSDAIRVRNNLDAIEAALAKGASRQDVYEWLKNETGLTLTFKAFATALRRQRLKRKESHPEPATAPTPAKVGQATQATRPGGVPVTVDNGAGLDPYSARMAREKILQTDYSYLDDRFK